MMEMPGLNYREPPLFQRWNFIKVAQEEPGRENWKACVGMLRSENSSKSTNDQDDPQEIFQMLIDLVSIFAFFVVRGCG